jgi:NADH:ubiquinone oxidoreductase subunit 6 (subunit J)
MGAIMLRIIYSLLLLVIFLCSAASVIWLLSFVGFELLLLVGACFVAFTSAVTLAEELVEWRRRRALHGELLPPAS